MANTAFTFTIIQDPDCDPVYYHTCGVLSGERPCRACIFEQNVKDWRNTMTNLLRKNKKKMI